MTRSFHQAAALLAMTCVAPCQSAPDRSSDAVRHRAQEAIDSAVQLIQAKKPDAALTEFRRAAEIDPSFSAPHYNLGRLFDLQGKYEAAAASYARYVSLEPTGEKAKEAASRVVLNLSLLEVSKTKAGATAVEYSLRLRRAQAAAGAGQDADAIGFLQSALEVAPEEEREKLRAFVASERERLREHSDSNTSNPADPQTGRASQHYRKAESLRVAGKLDAAIAEYRAATAIDASYADAHHGLALAMSAKPFLTKEEDAATTHAIATALRLNPDSTEYRRTLIMLIAASDARLKRGQEILASLVNRQVLGCDVDAEPCDVSRELGETGRQGYRVAEVLGSVSLAARLGIRTGDVIVRVQGNNAVSSYGIGRAIEGIANAANVVIEVLRPGTEGTVQLRARKVSR